MVRGIATVRRPAAHEWEESLCALAEELLFWAASRETLGRRGQRVDARDIARARLLARDLRLVAGLHESVDGERATALLEEAHTLLAVESGVRAVRVAELDELDDEVTAPGRMLPGQLRSMAEDFDDDESDATMPGVPADVFLKYLKDVRR